MAKNSHSGGAWKVAYADFVTALMALFMVLWITAQDKAVLLATSLYFRDPLNMVSSLAPAKDGGSKGKNKNLDKTPAAHLAFLQSIARELKKSLNINSDIGQENPVDTDVTAEDLKIVIYDRTKKPIFEKNNAQFTEWGKFVLSNMAWIVDRYELSVTIDGHTPDGFVLPEKNYGAWELTADRANAARRLLEFYAVDPKKIERVTGFANTKPLPNLSPDSESNQRITVSLAVKKAEPIIPKAGIESEGQNTPEGTIKEETKAIPGESAEPKKKEPRTER